MNIDNKMQEFSYKNNTDFSLEIDYYKIDESLGPDEGYKYYVCLKCLNPECLSINKKLEDIFSQEYDLDVPSQREEYEKELCLIKIVLNVYDKEKEMSNEQDTYNFSYRIFLEDFYNNAMKYGKGISYLNPKLKGAGAALMFIVLQSAVLNKRIKKDDVIVLEASGELDESEDMRGLVEYYEKLGFSIIDPELLDENLESATMTVPMKGTVEDILNATMTRFPMVSKEFMKILKELV